MDKFNQTLKETKAAFSYDLNKSNVKTFAKLADVENDTINGLPVRVDIHGLKWEDRVVLEVKTIDLDYRKAVVANINKLEWITDLDSITFCNEDGSRIKTNK